MAFIDEFNKLIVENGQLQKIANKDKAIIEIAEEIEKSPQMAKIISIWEKDNDVYTRLQSVNPEGTKPQMFNFSPTETKKLCYLCNDENEPQGDGSNVIVVVVDENKYQLDTTIKMPINGFSQSSRFDSDNDKLKAILNFWDETAAQQGNPDFMLNVNQ